VPIALLLKDIKLEEWMRITVVPKIFKRCASFGKNH